MPFAIDNNILRETTKCRNNFACLEGSKKCLNDVEQCINREVHFVNCKKMNSCDYLIPFGDTYVCNCPTRKEIYNRFRV